MTRRPPSQARGFGLLEAIVALVLLAGTGAALFSWLGTNLRAAGAMADANARAALQLRALEILETVNPAVSPKGQRQLQQLQVAWTSREEVPSQLSVPYAKAVRWNVGLYRMAVTASDAQSGVTVQFELSQLGVADLSAARAPAPTPEH